MLFRHPLRPACLAPLCLIVQLAFLAAPQAAYAVGTADGYVSVGTTTNPTSEFGVYGGATIGSSYNNMLAPTNGLLVQGNVGVGTTSPNALFDVENGPQWSSSNLGANILVGGNSNVRNNALGFLDANGSNPWAIWDTITNQLNFATAPALGNTAAAPSIKMVITGSGNVGIGTTAPQSKLHIQSGEVQVGSSGASCSAANAGAISYASGALSYCNGSAWTSAASGIGSTGYDALWTSPTAIGTGLIYESGGKVGIGTTSPNALLSLGNSTTAIKLALYDPASGNLFGIGALAGNLTFGANIPANGTPQMVLQQTSGNVGIGTTSPVATLDVNGYAHLAKNSSQPIACDAAHDGSLALASTRRPCECVSSAWIDVVYGTACSW